MDRHSAENELVLSMLSTASSLQKLNERLDRISLHSNSSPRTKSREGRDLQWQVDRESLSGMEDSANESQVLRLSHTSSKFDSAFGSQTDEDSGSLHNQSPRFNDHHAITHRSDSKLHYSAESSEHIHQSHKKRRKKRHQLHEHSASLDVSSPDITPELLRYSHKISLKSGSPKYSPTSAAAYLHPDTMGRLKRIDSTRSISSTASNSSNRSTSSRILSLGLSTDDLKEMASKSHTKKIAQTHSPAPKLDTKLKQTHTEVQEQAAGSNSDMDTGSTNSGASTPVLPKKFQLQTSEVLQHREIDSDMEATCRHKPIAELEYPLTPEVIVIDPKKDATDKVKEQPIDGSKPDNGETRSKEQSTAVPKSRKKPARVTINPTPIITQQPPTKGMVFYHESLTPQPSPRHQPSKRYNQNETDSPQKRSNTPKRRASILQRLRRRHGSFSSAKRPKRYAPVKRSFSDRMTYDIRKGWIDYEEDLEFISNPSKLRRVGRMIARKAGTLHIVQLNRPPSGLYGIYISQTGARPGIFISRFADSNAAKFYTGLLSPGDEIIRVNKEDVKNKSVDDVYDMLETLDTVIFSIVPVCSRPDW